MSTTNISAFDIGNEVDDDNARDYDVRITGARTSGDFISYENMDPSKVKRLKYVECLTCLYNPGPIYLDCHIKGFRVMESFGQEPVPQFYKGVMDPGRDPAKRCWLSNDQINAWMELLIKSRLDGARWTIAKSGTTSLNPGSEIF
ncbi:hypothetical protein Tco_0989806 [Tanacetum coccineum]|uniref:Uncharacterized protein n=1 Tax=Tanacetum coccineum TaxID=301880 RepID=A0ABQ5EV31_9ASTR